jgi:hypothetical protein
MAIYREVISAAKALGSNMGIDVQWQEFARDIFNNNYKSSSKLVNEFRVRSTEFSPTCRNVCSHLFDLVSEGLSHNKINIQTAFDPAMQILLLFYRSLKGDVSSEMKHHFGIFLGNQFEVWVSEWQYRNEVKRDEFEREVLKEEEMERNCKLQMLKLRQLLVDENMKTQLKIFSEQKMRKNLNKNKDKIVQMLRHVVPVVQNNTMGVLTQIV